MQKLIINITHIVFISKNRKLIFTWHKYTFFVKFCLSSKAIVSSLWEWHIGHLVIKLKIKYLREFLIRDFLSFGHLIIASVPRSAVVVLFDMCTRCIDVVGHRLLHAAVSHVRWMTIGVLGLLHHFLFYFVDDWSISLLATFTWTYRVLFFKRFSSRFW